VAHASTAASTAHDLATMRERWNAMNAAGIKDPGTGWANQTGINA
jgi:hypothetical protein